MWTVEGPPILCRKYESKSVLENFNCKLYFDRSVIADRTVHNKRPDVVMLDKTINEAFLIFVAVPNSHSIHSAITEKLQ